MDNPWNILSIYEFQYFNCPTCPFKNQSKQEFVNHAYDDHPDSLNYLLNITDVDSFIDIICPWDRKVIKVEDNILDPLKQEEFQQSDSEFYENISAKSGLEENVDPLKQVIIDEKLQQFDTEFYENNTQNDLEEIVKVEKLDTNKTKNFKCEICGRMFSENYLLSGHKKRVHKIFICKFKRCECTFDTEEDLQLHKQIHGFTLDQDENKIYKCTLCEKTFRSYTGRKLHYNVAHEKTINKCDICNKEFSNRNGLKIHIKFVHEGVKFTCEICGKECTDLKRHIKDMHEESIRDHKCTECEKTFKHKRHLQKHILVIHEGIKPHQCDQCGKAFSGSSGLKTHIINNHGGIKAFQCHKCDYKCAQKHMLNTHINHVHEGVKNHKCDHCQKFFFHEKNVLRHIKTVHEGQKDHKCETCGKHFTMKDSLKSHIKTVHEGQRNYKCNYCEKLFSQSSSLNTHIKTFHQDHMNYKCDLCEKIFNAIGNLQRHIKKVHEDQKNSKHTHKLFL